MRERNNREAIQINYIDSYDYQVVVNIKIILQTFNRDERKKISISIIGPITLSIISDQELHLPVFYSLRDALLAVGVWLRMKEDSFWFSGFFSVPFG